MSDERSFDDQLFKARQGDGASIQHLLYYQYDYLARFVSSQIGSGDNLGLDVEDVLQDAFVHVIRDIKNCNAENEKAFRGWLRAVTRNRIRDAIKHRRRKKRDGKMAPVVETENGSRLNLVDLLPGEVETPSVHAATMEATRTLDIWLATLPDDQREAVRLRYMHRLSPQEIADQMEKSQGAVRGLLHRAKIKLRELMGRSSLWLAKKH